MYYVQIVILSLRAVHALYKGMLNSPNSAQVPVLYTATQHMLALDI
jgi:hypothetical protein